MHSGNWSSTTLETGVLRRVLYDKNKNKTVKGTSRQHSREENTQDCSNDTVNAAASVEQPARSCREDDAIH